MSGPRDGFVIASAIRQDLSERRGEWSGATAGYCRECGRTIFSQQFDWVCNATSCGGDAEFEQDQIRRRAEALRSLHRDTAAMLRRIGHPEEADYHDRMAR
jgi:hypothetical protein